MTLPLRTPLRSTPFPIIADLTTDRVTALGVEAGGVCDLCRKLIAIGVDPATPLHAYRGFALALRIRTIGEGALLRVTTNAAGTPVFVKAPEPTAAAPPIAKSPPTAPTQPPDENNAPAPVTTHATRPGGRP
jgi:hypothetical protein